MATTPRPVIDSVVRSVCGCEVERLVRLIGGGLPETYRVEVHRRRGFGSAQDSYRKSGQGRYR